MTAKKPSAPHQKKTFESAVPFNRTEKCVIRLIREHHRIGRVQLARMMGMTRAAMSTIINSLLERQVLKTSGKTALKKSAGRPVELLELDGRSFYGIGIAVSHHIEIAILDLAGNVCAFDRRTNSLRTAGKNSAAAIDKVVQRLLAVHNSANVADRTLLGVGISTVGVTSGQDADASANEFLRTDMFQDVDQANRFVQTLESTFNAPVVIEHEARAALLAESIANPDLPPPPNALLIQEKLGCAIRLDGRAYQGPPQAMRWLGCLQVNPQGDTCDGLIRGALALTASPEAMIYKLRNHSYHWDKQLKHDEMQQGRRAILEAFSHKNPEGLELINRAFTDIGLIVRNLATLFSPDLIIFHGWPRPIAKEGIKIVEALLAEMPDTPQSRQIKPVIRQASFGQKQQAIGTVLRVFDEAMRENQPQIT